MPNLMDTLEKETRDAMLADKATLARMVAETEALCELLSCEPEPRKAGGIRANR